MCERERWKRKRSKLLLYQPRKVKISLKTYRKAKKKRKAPVKTIAVMPEYQGAKLKDIPVQGDTFKDLVFSEFVSREGEYKFILEF